MRLKRETAAPPPKTVELVAAPSVTAEVADLFKQIEARDQRIHALEAKVEAFEWLAEGLRKGHVGQAQAVALLSARR